nr:hypothetical protein [Deltaproteobacteria bacterium]
MSTAPSTSTPSTRHPIAGCSAAAPDDARDAQALRPRPAGRGGALARPDRALEGVAEPAFDPRHLPPVRLDRRAERYRPAVAFADLILRNASVELHHGYTDAIGFLVNMNVVFENFVVEALRRRLAVAGTRWTHHPAGLFLDEGRAFAVEPDALWTTADGRPLLVLDAKYKTTSQGVIQDAYQMLAYCTALGLSSGVLVYASTTPHTHRVRNTATDIITLGLDPSGEIPEVERAIDELAERLRTLVPGWAVA